MQGQVVDCNAPSETVRVEEAMARIENSVDPCGQTEEMRDVLATLRRCTTATYQICTRAEIARNLFDRPPAEPGSRPTRVISWNPALDTELEEGCDGDPAKPVRRDPTASLLHELAHAAHDCLGVDPGQLELEAVRIENIYRRAAGLCQRSRYGEDLLPAELQRTCDSAHCPCTPANASGEVARRSEEEGASPDGSARLGDSAEHR